jgi:hypothetical protein
MNPITFMKRSFLYGLGWLGMKPDDILLVSFPRSGNTWIRFILCNYLNLLEMNEKEVDFHVLDRTMPELGKNNLLKEWPYSSIPRIIKSHQPYRSFMFFRPKQTIYIIRDPRDVVISYYYYVKSRKMNVFSGDLKMFIRHPKFGLEATILHYVSWKNHISYLLRYEELKNNQQHFLKEVFTMIGAEFDENVMVKAIELSSFENIKEAQNKTGISGKKRFEDDFQFARKGVSSQWLDHFNQQDIILYAELCERYKYYFFDM